MKSKNHQPLKNKELPKLKLSSIDYEKFERALEKLNEEYYHQITISDGRRMALKVWSELILAGKIGLKIEK